MVLTLTFFFSSFLPALLKEKGLGCAAPAPPFFEKVKPWAALWGGGGGACGGAPYPGMNDGGAPCICCGGYWYAGGGVKCGWCCPPCP
eukprot:CAMPEP_0182453546 /NCGR_PEP_ID=MMETSP1319-20130603/566_1 /TAXON_ID=172717 /ORGANISM="Bolidomonas pacifica, Strain RCC208" /LENGTH=87 /DNA_ID=CAMNT_0024651489 /DNA_START=78 /DNA_END=341 /DNA_ORIENTATION=+